MYVSAPLCQTPCDPMNYSPPGSSGLGILQARILGGLQFPSPGDLPDPGIKPRSSALQADSLPSESPRKPSLSLYTHTHMHMYIYVTNHAIQAFFFFCILLIMTATNYLQLVPQGTIYTEWRFCPQLKWKYSQIPKVFLLIWSTLLISCPIWLDFNYVLS